MKLRKLKIGAIFIAAVAFAQGPPPGFRQGPPDGFGFGPGGRGRGPGGMAGPRSKVVAGSPYSAVETRQTTQVLSDGTQINRSEQSNVYRDSQGRVRTETSMVRRGGTAGATPAASPGASAATNSEPRTMVTIFDPVEGSTTRLDAQRLTADKTMLAAGDAGRRPSPPPGSGPRNRPGGTQPQTQTQDLGTRTINGLTATGTRTTMTIPAGEFGNSKTIQSVREVWMSADLQEPVMITTSDPRFGTNTTQLTNITRNEPDAALFVAPANYKVTTHSRPAGPPRSR